MCKKRFTLLPLIEDCAEASSSSLTAKSYVSATALIEGRIIGCSTGSFISSPNRKILSFRPRKLSMYSLPVLIGIKKVARSCINIQIIVKMIFGI